MTISHSPLISIIVNCYNGEKYLTQALECILKQTYKKWEVIFWDNQSTDKSADIFKTYQDERFKYFYAEKHTSLYEARNLAIEKSKGDFISFLDTDDLWSENKLSLQISYFKSIEVGVVYSNLWLIKKSEKTRRLYSKKNLPSGKIFDKLINNYNVGILTVLIRKKYYLDLETKFDSRFSIIGDFDLMLRLSKLCVFESIQEPLASYRLHGENLSTVKKENEIEEYKIWLKENNCNLDSFHINKIIESVSYKKFVNYKIDGKYFECFKMIFNSKVNKLYFKKLIIFFIPIIILKKIFWYHQD
jgi:glycosyltransferase involved in cell wall biosynthesis